MRDLAERVRCPVASACGGCALIGSAYADQLVRKREMVTEALADASLPEIPVDPCVAAPRTAAYRNRAKLAVARAADGVHIGLHRRGTDEVVDLAPCLVQSEETATALPALRGWLDEHRLAAPQGPVRYLDLRQADGQRHHLTLVVTNDPEVPPELPLQELLERLPSLVGVSVNHNPTRSSYVFGTHTRTVHGARSFVASVPSVSGGSVALEVPATGFFQVATGSLPSIHQAMLGHFGPSLSTVVDLYCGVGLHGLALAFASNPGKPSIVGVEEHPASAACARRNAHRLGVEASYRTGRVESLLDGLGQLDDGSCSAVVLNPGRAGCRTAVVERLSNARCRRMAYLSCNPQTLARDLRRIVAGGWRVRRVVPFDLMPQTDQVETLALLERHEARE